MASSPPPYALQASGVVLPTMPDTVALRSCELCPTQSGSRPPHASLKSEGEFAAAQPSAKRPAELWHNNYAETSCLPKLLERREMAEAKAPPPSLAKAYEPHSIESSYYQNWLDTGAFTPPSAQKKEKSSTHPLPPSYTIALPPPNVTGVLTMGHLLNGTIQDILIRRARQSGYDTLWIPGTDHAGIGTQTKVEKLIQSEGSSRQALGREGFLKRVLEWRDKHGGLINEQFKKLGVSCDWSRSVHTLDAGYSQAVLEAFVQLYKRGYIYKGQRLVNWCPASQTALSDEEVIMKPNVGKLYFIRYAIVSEGEGDPVFKDQAGGGPESLIVATTRPETLMADVALAVHPEDSRYQHLIGKKAYRPFPKEPLPIIADTAVDPSFGTGVLKITPAHDRLDFEIAKRHALPSIELIGLDGTLKAQGQEFSGLDRLKARPLVVKKLKALGALVEERPYENTIGYSERADVPVETLLSEQWFLKYPKVEEAKQVVEQGLIQFWPKHWEKTYLHWLDKIQDWCISRQLWWGHRIPVWYKKGSDKRNAACWHVSSTPPKDLENWEQDPDVLDTWFSSWLWPFAIQGWPDKEQMEALQLQHFYPTHTLVTGPDIIFFWVARMIMASLEFNPLQSHALEKRIPFQNVYFTGIIRDSQGRKMSKSLGNSPEPLDLIAKYGADGLRLGMISMAPQGQDIAFQEDRLAQGRNFCNKLWNAARFRLMSGPLLDNSGWETILKRLDPSALAPEDHFILQELLTTLEAIETAYQAYDFQAITQQLYRFFWSGFCDWYLEFLKARPAAHKSHTLSLQDFILGQVLTLIHPFCPFISEKLAHTLGYIPEVDYLHNTPPLSSKDLKIFLQSHGLTPSADALSTYAKLQETVIALRKLKADHHVAARKDVSILVKVVASQTTELELYTPTLLKLVGLQKIRSVESLDSSRPSTLTPFGTFSLESLSTTPSPHLMAQYEEELKRLDKLIALNAAKLNNPSFVSSAPAKVVEGARKLLEEHSAKKAELLATTQNQT